MSYRFLLLSSVVALASCAYAIETHIQDVKFTTPGARGSVCYAYVDGLRYRVHPPQTISVNNTKEDLIVDCLAPGNRRKKVVIEPKIADSTYLNAANALAGVPWDAFSGAAFKFPDIVEIDFTHTEVRPEDPPAQNAPDIKQPEEYMLEEFLPSQPKLNSDRYSMPVELEKRDRGSSSSAAFVDKSFTYESLESPSIGKGDLPPATVNINPAPEIQSTTTSNPPIPLYPGQ